MARTGRPRKAIDRDNFEKLCGIQCTLDEISGFFDCSADTIERWCKREYHETFAETYKKKSAGGKISLRRNQFRLAEKNAAMAIFLGKNYLGQQDHLEMTDTEALDILKNILAQNKENAKLHTEQEAE